MSSSVDENVSVVLDGHRSVAPAVTAATAAAAPKRHDADSSAAEFVTPTKQPRLDVDAPSSPPSLSPTRLKTRHSKSNRKASDDRAAATRAQSAEVSDRRHQPAAADATTVLADHLLDGPVTGGDIFLHHEEDDAIMDNVSRRHRHECCCRFLRDYCRLLLSSNTTLTWWWWVDLLCWCPLFDCFFGAFFVPSKL